MADYHNAHQQPKEEYPALDEQAHSNAATGPSLPFPSELITSHDSVPLPHAGAGGVAHPGINADAFANYNDFNFCPNREIPVDWEHVDRKSAGCSVIDTNSKLDDSGRTFHGYKEGKYFLPNDAVSRVCRRGDVMTSLLNYVRRSKIVWTCSMPPSSCSWTASWVSRRSRTPGLFWISPRALASGRWTTVPPNKTSGSRSPGH